MCVRNKGGFPDFEESGDELTVRRAEAGDLARLEAIYDSARRYMRSQGNHSQWSDGYPSATTALEDMAHGWCYVVEWRGQVVATFCLMTAEEPAYASLADADGAPYVTLHRVASDGRAGAILKTAVEYAVSHYHCDIRIDTHADNVAMLAAIGRAGFAPAGEITLADGSPRLAFRLAVER